MNKTKTKYTISFNVSFVKNSQKADIEIFLF